MKIVAITVTYNRSNTLEKTISSLLNQSYQVDKIIIVDNNSNSIHKEKIIDLKKLDSKRIDILNLNDNLGGAGGFEAGMRYAESQYNPDWYWVMDDDAYPRSECLSNLLKYTKLEDIGCLCPIAYGIDNNDYQLYHHKKISSNLIYDYQYLESYESLDEYGKIDANAFVGPLISKAAVGKVGIANGSLFIYGDDTEYTYRVNQFFNNYVVKDAIIDHQDQPSNVSTTSPTFWWKEYYCYRNRFLFIDEFSQNAFKSFSSKSIYSFILLKSVIAAFIKPGYKHYRILRSKIILKAIKDGLLKRTGKIIDPKFYLDNLKKEWL